MADGANTPGPKKPRKPRKGKPAVPTGTGAATGGSVSGTERPPRPPADLVDLRPDGPFRPPDYRWQLAGRVAAGAPVPGEWLDKWSLRAEEVLSAPPGRAVDAPDLRAVAAARDLSVRGPYWQRVEVEARLLAGEAVAVIAAKAGLTAAAVEAYAALFYAVADRLQHPGYIAHLAVRVYADGAEGDVGVQVRMMAYRGGPLVLDAVLDAVAGPRAGTAGTAGDASADSRRVRKLARLAVGLRVTPVTEANAVVWARLYALMRECRALGVRPG